jgi:hypothetical protein
VSRSDQALARLKDHLDQRRSVERPADYLVRAATATLLGHARRQMPLDIVRQHWADDEATPLVLKAATAPATLTTSGWASQLAATAVADLISTLAPQSAGAAVLRRGLSLQFDGAGALVLPGVVSAAADVGFVQEGAPIPVRQLVVGSLTLAPRKFAVTTSLTGDIEQHSTPNIEALVRAVLSESVAASLDAALFDTTAGDAVRPPGLRNGIAANHTASTATPDTEAMHDDLSQLIGAVAPVAGSAPIVIVASPRQAAAIRLRYPTLGYEVFSSSGLAAGVLAAIATNAVASAVDPAPRLDMSRETLLHMDTAPSPISTTGGAPFTAPMRSMFQTDTNALRLILEVSWGLRTTGLAWTSGVTW